MNDVVRLTGTVIGAGAGLFIFKYALANIDMFSDYIVKLGKAEKERSSQDHSRPEDSIYKLAMNKLVTGDYRDITEEEMLFLQAKADHPEYQTKAIKY